jgi:hypothetical protein
VIWPNRGGRADQEAERKPSVSVKADVQDNGNANVQVQGVQHNYLGPVYQTSNDQSLPSWLSPLPVEPEPDFVGRKAELSTALSLVEAGNVVPVIGPEHTGKSAFIERLMTEDDFARALTRNRSWALLKFDVPGGGSRFPVSRALLDHIDATLFTVEEFGADTVQTERKIKHALGILPGSVGARDLVVVIDCAQFGKDVADLDADLDEVLTNSVFRRSVVFVACTEELSADGGQQLRHMPPVRLGPLAEDEAAELLSAALTKLNLRVSAAQEVIEQANDDIARRPHILRLGVAQHGHRYPHAPVGILRDVDPDELAFDLLDACRLTVAKELVDAGCALLDGSGAPGALAPLAVWSLSSETALPGDVLLGAGVGIESLKRLVEHGVLVESRPADDPAARPHHRLSPATREALRNLMLLALDRKRKQRLQPAESAALGRAAEDARALDAALSHAAGALFNSWLSHAADEDDSIRRAVVRAIEYIVGWLKDQAPDRLPMAAEVLEHRANSLAVDAIVLPVEPSGLTGDEPRPVVDDVSEDDQGDALYRAVSTLNVRMREPVTAQSTSLFVEACARAATALRGRGPDWPPDMLHSIDTALYFGGRHFQCGPDVLRIRVDLEGLLREDAARTTAGRTSRLRALVSWLLNTAELQLEEQQVDGAKASAGRAAEVLGSLPEPTTPAGTAALLWLRTRVAKTRARTAGDESERLAALREAEYLSATGLAECAPTASLRHLWTRRFLEAAKNHALELREDEDRVAAVLAVTGTVARYHGPDTDWSSATCLSMARFLRSVYLQQADPALRLAGANTLVDLLASRQSLFADQAQDGDPTGLLALAGAVGFKAEALAENDRWRDAVAESKLAEQHAAQAVAHAPGAYSYRVWLGCLQSHEALVVNSGGDEKVSAQNRRQAIRQIKQWLGAEKTRSTDHATLARLCIEEEWRRSGRSLKTAVVRADACGAFRLDLLDQVYAARVHVLDGHEKRYGPTVDATLLRARLEREYRQLLAMHGPRTQPGERVVDNASTWAILDRAARAWPHNNAVRFAKARLHRYLWQNREAAELLDAIIMTARSGHERRQAQIEIAEVLLMLVRYGGVDDRDRDATLLRAAAHLSEPLGHRFQSERVVVLRDWITLESGAEIDWQRIDATFGELIGDDYATSIGDYLHRRRYAPAESSGDKGPFWRDDAPSEDGPTLTELLYEHFTEVELIQGLGQLYLRHCELLGSASEAGAAETALRSAQRAYDCFDACRVLLEGHYDKELAVNRFRRAEAVRLAAQLTGTADPFPWHPENKPSWLKLAVDLYQSASGGSVGAFHMLCVQRIRQAEQLLMQIATTDPSVR